MSLVGIIPVPEHGRPDPHDVGTMLDGHPVIPGHAHGQKIHIDIIYFFPADVNK